MAPFRSLILLLLWLLPAVAATAHELPQRVAIRMIVSATPQQIDVMLRVPLEAMRDVDFPLTPEGYLRLDDASAALAEAAGLWIVDNIALHAEGRKLTPDAVESRVALPSNRAFRSVEGARAHFRAAPLDANTQLYWRQAMLDVHLRYPPAPSLAPGALRLDVALRHLGESTRVELLLAESGAEAQTLSFDGDVRDLPLKASWCGVLGDFLRDGMLHIAIGIDHLLFLFCLVLPLRQFWPLVKTVTAFTLAHSLTLAAAALGWVPGALWFPSLVESVIALSIVFLAIENALRTQFQWRWVTAFAFGLAHGFGFAAALGDALQFAQGHRLLALAGFNLGVEIGQLAVLVVLLPALALLMRKVSSERLAIIVLSLVVAHTGWHWMTERLETFSGYFL